ncbi:MAG TPA: ABC transporter permease [Burkholderiaceae bacterium]|jgi:peptide/nickel transport system permease protein|nr:ABC transporter permease [Burkholderiaceae bacterium]
MVAFTLRRVLYSVLVLFGVNAVTFVLFFAVNTPDDMARMQLGRRVTAEAIERWKAQQGYDRPLFLNARAPGLGKITDTVFFETTRKAVSLDLGRTNEGVVISEELSHRVVPSAMIALPVLALVVTASVLAGLTLILFRATTLERAGVIALVALMSISTLFFIITGQYVFARVMQLMPISGFVSGGSSALFVALPVAVLGMAYLGPEARLFRAVFLEELGKDYVRTARAKGLSEFGVMGHVLRNSLIPIITSSGLLLPVVFTSTIVTETFFTIPGLGSFAIEGITQQDFNIVRAMVFIGSALYIMAFLLTDLAYGWADPRVRLR